MIDQLLNEHTYHQAASILTQQGITSGEGKTFTASRLRAHCDRYRLRSHYQRLRDAGLRTLDEIASELGSVRLAAEVGGIWSARAAVVYDEETFGWGTASWNSPG